MSSVLGLILEAKTYVPSWVESARGPSRRGDAAFISGPVSTGLTCSACVNADDDEDEAEELITSFGLRKARHTSLMSRNCQGAHK